MAQAADRIQCPRCGSNNFSTVTACWKCSAPLAGAPSAPAPGYMPSPVTNPAFTPNPAFAPAAGPAAETFGYRASGATAMAAQIGNPNLSNKAAIWLGLSMPYFGLPIALAFMMCDDRRRQQVGRICLIWSLVSAVIHFLLLVVTTIPLVRSVQDMILPAIKAGVNRGGGMGGGLGGGGVDTGP